MSKYVTMFSGTRVFKDKGVPTLKDLAISLCRTPMFAGAAKRHYSVAHHSLGVAFLMPKHKIYGLFHEAEVPVLGDCPGPAKVNGQYELDNRIRNDFIRSLGLPVVTPEIWRMVEEADYLDQAASARFLGHPDALEAWPAREALDEAMDNVKMLYNEHPPHLQLEEDSSLVKMFMWYATDLIADNN